MLNTIIEWDREIVIFLYHSFYKFPFIREVLWFLSSIEVYSLGIILLWYFILALLSKNKHRIITLWLYSTIIFASFWLGQLLSIVAPFRMRPFVFLDIVPIISHISNASFPSSHALFFGMSIVILTRWFFPLYQKIILIFLGWIMCLSRVISAIHYPSDILVWIIIWAFLWYCTYRITFLISSRFYTLNHT